ncbi:MAG TPA: hypothetical protein VNY52_04555 [Solirubrobacteraceae bacterium]|nr:hypothetical protein [Solirubrobacteraceae bacterium]
MERSSVPVSSQGAVATATAPDYFSGYAPAVARLLIVGGGCRGLALAEAAGSAGHAVRVVTRAQAHRAGIEAAGAECWIGDPDRLGTLRGALEGVAIGCWLLGTAVGPREQLEALHGDRLRSFLEGAIDTPMRGFLYEASGTVPAGMLAAGIEVARAIAARNAIPLTVLRTDPGDPRGWLEGARYAVENLLKTDQDSNNTGGFPCPAM